MRIVCRKCWIFPKYVDVLVSIYSVSISCSKSTTETPGQYVKSAVIVKTPE